jgi:hypothetical protein
MRMGGNGNTMIVTSKKTWMEKRILGVILSALGVIGLILAAVRFANSGSGAGGQSARLTIIFLVLGVIFFFSGISLVRGTKDKAT